MAAAATSSAAAEARPPGMVTTAAGRSAAVERYLTWGAAVRGTREAKVTGQPAAPLEAAAAEAVAARGLVASRRAGGAAHTDFSARLTGSSATVSELPRLPAGSLREREHARPRSVAAANLARARALLHSNRLDPLTHDVLVPSSTAVWAATLRGSPDAADLATAAAAAAEVEASMRGTRTSGSRDLRRTAHGFKHKPPHGGAGGMPPPPPFALDNDADIVGGVGMGGWASTRRHLGTTLPPSYPVPGTEGERTMPPEAQPHEIAASRWDAAGRWWRARNYNALLGEYYDASKEADERGREASRAAASQVAALRALPRTGLPALLYDTVTGAPVRPPLQPALAASGGAGCPGTWDTTLALPPTAAARHDAVLDDRALARFARRAHPASNPILGIPAPDELPPRPRGLARTPGSASCVAIPPTPIRPFTRIAADAGATASAQRWYDAL